MKSCCITVILASIMLCSASAYGKSSSFQSMQDSLYKLEKSHKSIIEGKNTEHADAIIRQHGLILAGIFSSLKMEKNPDIIPAGYRKEIRHLEARVALNRMRGNGETIQGDNLKIAVNRVNERIWTFISFLIRARNRCTPASQVIEHVDEEKNLLNSKGINARPITPGESSYKKLQGIYLEYQAASATYAALLEYAKENVESLVTTSWTHYLKIRTLIMSINSSSEKLKSFNSLLAPVGLSAGKLVIATLAFFLYFGISFLLGKIEKRIEDALISNDKSFERNQVFYNKIHRPFRAIVVFFVSHMVFLVLFFDTSLEKYISIACYTIYSVLLVYLFSNIIDVMAIIRIDSLDRSNRKLREEFINLFIRVVKAVFLAAVVITGLDQYGIKITTILSTLGIGGLAVALAAKDSLANFFGGLVILMDDVYRQGDWIQVDDVDGTVVELGIRSTTVRSFPNALITVPNSSIAGQQVINWSRREVGRRIKLSIGVGCDCDSLDLKNAVKEIRGMLKMHPGIAQPAGEDQHDIPKMAKLVAHTDLKGVKNIQLVYFDSIGDFTFNILVYCFTKTTDWDEWLRVKEELLYGINEIVERNNLTIPYPTRVVINRNEDSLPLA